MPDAIDIPSWNEFQAARRRFFDGLAADTASRSAEGAGRLRARSHAHDAESSRHETTPLVGAHGRITPTRPAG